MKRSAVLDALDETERRMVGECRRAEKLIMLDEPTSPTYVRLLAETHKALLGAYTAGALEADEADLLPEGVHPLEALARLEQLKQHYMSELSDCDGTA